MIDINPKADNPRAEKLRDIYGDPEAEIKEIEREFLRLQFLDQLSRRIKH